MHITNPKISFDIFMVVTLQNIFLEYDKFDPHKVLLAIATNIPVLLMTFVV